MEGKYVATIEFTSLHALKTFFGIINPAGGSVIISGERRQNNSEMLDNPILVINSEAENVLIPEIKVCASSTIDLEKAKVALNCEIDDVVEKSAAITLLESVTKFTGVRNTFEVREL